MLHNPKWDNRSGELLEKAADLIEERGHVQYRYTDDEGRLCIYGALATAQGLSVDTLYRGSPDFDMTPVVRFTKHTKLDPCSFNNSHSKEEVIAALRSAAKS